MKKYRVPFRSITKYLLIIIFAVPFLFAVNNNDYRIVKLDFHGEEQGIFIESKNVIDSQVDPMNIGVEEWTDDFNSFYDLIEYSYPYIKVKERTHGYNWLDLKEGYLERLGNLQNNTEFLKLIYDMTQALQNRHTYVLDPELIPDYRESYGNWISFFRDEVFDETAVNASYNWKPIYDAYYDEIYNTAFDIKIVYNQGRYIIVDGEEDWASKYGLDSENQTIIAVNGIPIDVAVRSSYETDYLDWDYYRNKSYLWLISPRNFGANATFTLENENEITSNITISTEFGQSFNPYVYPTSIDTPIVFKTFTDGTKKIGYINIRTFSKYALESYYTEIQSFLQDLTGYEGLIIDIRGNTGGTSNTWRNHIVKPLINKTVVFKNYIAHKPGIHFNIFREENGRTEVVPKESFDHLPPEVYSENFTVFNYTYTIEPTFEVNFSGKIALLTDNVVYSAAEFFAMFCKQTGFATIIGTSTGGDGVIPSPTFYTLPNSKIIVKLATSLGLDYLGYSNEEFRTQPDILYESLFGNFNEMIDYVLNRSGLFELSSTTIPISSDTVSWPHRMIILSLFVTIMRRRRKRRNK